MFRHGLQGDLNFSSGKRAFALHVQMLAQRGWNVLPGWDGAGIVSQVLKERQDGGNSEAALGPLRSLKNIVILSLTSDKEPTTVQQQQHP